MIYKADDSIVKMLGEFSRRLKSIFKKILILFLLLCFTFTVYSQSSVSNDEKLKSFLQIIQSNYYEPVDVEKVVEAGVRSMLDELDMYSRYFTKEEINSLIERYRGVYNGIGVHYYILNDTIVVVYPFPGSSAETEGLMSGDKIISINREDATGSHVDKEFVNSRLRGNYRTSVRLVVLRRGKTHDFRVVRRKVRNQNVDAYFMATEDVGYIKINRFSGLIENEMSNAFGELSKRGMKHLILDLSYNAGGYLSVCVRIVNNFLTNDKLIVQTKGRDEATSKSFKSSTGGSLLNGKLVIIVNKESASASEILAGAIQDWDRGLIVGQRTYGKGLVQHIHYLPDSSSVRLTSAAYFTPSGRNIQRPLNYEHKNLRDELIREGEKRLERGELLDASKILTADTSVFYTKRNNRIVYGGGGITPDVFVPIDTTTISSFYYDLMRSGVLNSFSLEYTSRYRRLILLRNRDIDAFMNNFEVDDRLLKKLYKYAGYYGIKNEEETFEDEMYLHNQLKALIARNIWGFGAYVRVIMQIDDSYLKAIEIIQDDTFDKLNIYY